MWRRDPTIPAGRGPRKGTRMTRSSCSPPSRSTNRQRASAILGSMSRSGDAHDRDDDRPNPGPAPAREPLIDRQIREAQEAGAFDDLPYRGQRIPLDDDSLAGD